VLAVAVPADDAVADAAAALRKFAREARGRSAAYEVLAASAAADASVTRFVASLPQGKRQPNLLFAAARYLLGYPAGLGQLRELATQDRVQLTEIMLTRRTQTNEPARCAVLLPALAQLPQPIALIDVGASAGLTLLADRYSYDYAGHRLAGTDPRGPTLRCEPRGPVPLPPRIPVIAWRAGLDLSPLDVTSDDDVRWLSCLVWPGENDRQERLAAAIASARREPPAVHRGDLVADLPALAAQAPPDATLVIWHSSVLYQVTAAEREHFADAVRSLGAVLLSCEAPGVVAGTADMAARASPFTNVLARDGRALAVADGHGAWLHWLG
jgi:hypothetical protein